MNLPHVPKIYRLGESHTAGVLSGPGVVIEEKYDGSQFSFGIVEGKLQCRSKENILDLNAPGMFALAVKTAKQLFEDGKLVEGWIYLCEFLAKPKHNVLTYSRVPAGNLVLYDVRCIGAEGSHTFFMDPKTKQSYARELGLEPVRDFSPEAFDFVQNDLKIESSLGGTDIEGVVVKNYFKPHAEHNTWPLTAKLVAERFKERMKTKPRNPKSGLGEIVEKLVACLRTEARWLKAVQHLRESEKLNNTRADIGPLCKEIINDLDAEEREWIKEKLFEHFIKDISRGVLSGFADWYQEFLAGGPSTWQEHKLGPNNEGPHSSGLGTVTNAEAAPLSRPQSES